MILYDLNNCNVLVGDKFLYKRINAELIVLDKTDQEVIFGSIAGTYAFTHKKIFGFNANIPGFDPYLSIRKL